MIEGIEILNKTEITDAANYSIVLTIVFLMLIVIGMFISAHGVKILNDALVILGIILIVSGLIAGIILGVINSQQPTGKYEYQVTIDDSVSLTEFYDTYEIMEQNGKIWTIREKTNEKD